MDVILDPPAACGAPLFHALLKSQAADFCVFEELDIEFSGNGEHLYLQIEKTAMNTDEVAALLQDCFGVGSADIGYCGLKDRHSVSTQWFSVRSFANPDAVDCLIAKFHAQQQSDWGEAGGYLKSLRLLNHARHSRKLKRGAHRLNQFRITLRNMHSENETAQGLRVRVDERVQRLQQRGFPNYIGAQRFGPHGQNLHRAMQWFGKPRKRTSRQQRSLWLSAARSALFNTVCSARVQAGTWTMLLPGEPAMLDGSRSFFATADGQDEAAGQARADEQNGAAGQATADEQNGTDRQDEAMKTDRESLSARLRDLDIHPSAPWWGRGDTPAKSLCAEFESGFVRASDTLCKGLERAGLDQERRAIRARANDLAVNWVDDQTCELSFSLAPGVFATSLLREICRFDEPVRTSLRGSSVSGQPESD